VVGGKFRTTGKLRAHYDEPYEILEVLNSGRDYWLQLGPNNLSHPVFHISKLKLYHSASEETDIATMNMVSSQPQPTPTETRKEPLGHARNCDEGVCINFDALTPPQCESFNSLIPNFEEATGKHASLLNNSVSTLTHMEDGAGQEEKTSIATNDLVLSIPKTAPTGC
jgi:hypothetical protein